MTLETVITLIFGLLGGAVGGKLIDLFRFRIKDRAEATKIIHDSQSASLQAGALLLDKLVSMSDESIEKIRQLNGQVIDRDATIRELQHAAALCRDALERCREKNGCE